VCVCEIRSRACIVYGFDTELQTLFSAVGGTTPLVLFLHAAAAKSWLSYPPDPQQQYLANLTARTEQLGIAVYCAL